MIGLRAISPKARARLRTLEGERLTTYLCSAGKPTIGVGHTGSDVRMGMTITAEESDRLLTRDLVRFERCVGLAVKVPLTQNQFDALVIFAFNVGEEAFRKSTLLKKLNHGGYADVPAQLLRWVHVAGEPNKGLENRRNAEIAIWEGR